MIDLITSLINDELYLIAIQVLSFFAFYIYMKSVYVTKTNIKKTDYGIFNLKNEVERDKLTNELAMKDFVTWKNFEHALKDLESNLTKTFEKQIQDLKEIMRAEMKVRADMKGRYYYANK